MKDIKDIKNIDVEELKRRFQFHLESDFAKELDGATKLDVYDSFVFTVRDLLIKRWIKSKKEYLSGNHKTVNYISMEFLMGRSLVNSLLNLDIYSESAKALLELGVNLEELQDVEWDAGLGNGGLGRLAACFLDSLTTLQYPAFGYGIRYEYGIFQQKIQDGAQIELPDNWLRYGNPWEIPRPELIYLIPFYGDVKVFVDKHGRYHYQWQASQDYGEQNQQVSLILMILIKVIILVLLNKKLKQKIFQKYYTLMICFLKVKN
jgi:starch phosphorylase